MLKKTMILLAIFVLTCSIFGMFKVVEKGDANLSIGGSMIPRFTYDLDAEGDAPRANFGLGTAWLYALGDISKDFSYLVLYYSSNGDILLADVNIEYTGIDNLSVRAGYYKLPFGRMFNSSGLSLLFNYRNPLNNYYGNDCSTGMSAKYSLFNSKVDIEAGVFNADGSVAPGSYQNLKYSGYVAIAPMGQLPSGESAHMGYDEPKFVIMPGFAYNEDANSTLWLPDEILRYGVHGALRYKTLAMDVLYYMSSENNENWDDPLKTSGFSVQAGYAINKIEPCFRFTVYDPNTDEDNDELTLGINSVTTIEAGLNYYINSYASRLGINYVNSSTAEDKDDLYKTSLLEIFYELQF